MMRKKMSAWLVEDQAQIMFTIVDDEAGETVYRTRVETDPGSKLSRTMTLHSHVALAGFEAAPGVEFYLEGLDWWAASQRITEAVWDV